MKLKANYHTHCEFDDGLNICEDIVKKAISSGMESIGFSAHYPISYENEWCMKWESVDSYFNTVSNLKTKYLDKIKIYLGIEAEYIFANQEEEKLYNSHKSYLDYEIGAVHCFYEASLGKLIMFDGTLEEREEAMRYFLKPKNFCESYYAHVLKIINKNRPDIIAHLDQIKKFNHMDKIFNENSMWYKNLVCSSLDKIKQYGTIVEVNTGGIVRGYSMDIYPSLWIIKECFKRDIKIVLSSDAHDKNNITAHFDETIKELKRIGYKGSMILESDGWKYRLFN